MKKKTKELTQDKVSITITGESPYDIYEEMDLILKGRQALSFLYEWENFMRAEVKYRDNDKYEEVREKFYEIKKEYELIYDD
jgi:hypothetical protein